MTDNKEVFDAAIGGAVERVPPGKFRQFLTQAGVLGLILAWLVGNIPVTAAMAGVLSGKGKLDTDAITLYFDIFVVVMPWVLLVGLFVFYGVTERPLPVQGPPLLFLVAFLVCGAATLSYGMGAAVPLKVLAGQQHGGPGGSAEYIVSSFGDYFMLYGPGPIIAGLLEGGFFGYWAGVLDKSP